MERSLSFALLALSLAAGNVLAEEVFRWVDKDGNVHFGDSPPPEYADQMFEDRLPRQSVEDEAAAQQARQDRILLQTYLSVADIEAVRDERLESLQDRLTQSYLENLHRHLGELEADFENVDGDDSADEDSTALAAEISETRRKIEVYEAELEQSAVEQAEIRQKFDQDIDRFRQLTAVASGG
jgi:hypothetical protein